jgi:hypothetical protein
MIYIWNETEMEGDTMFKRVKMVLLTVLLITGLSVPCSATETGVKNLFENSLYGGLAGTLVGAACLAFTHTPEDHLNYLYIGAASGVILGVVYSVAQESKSLVAVENGTVKIAMPTITPQLQRNGDKEPAALMLTAELISGRF